MKNKLNNLYVGGLVNRGRIKTFSSSYSDLYGKFKLSSENRFLEAKVSHIDKDYILVNRDYFNTALIVLNIY